MRLLILLLTMVIVFGSFAFDNSAEAACSKNRCTGGPEWLGVNELGIDLSMPDLNSNQPKEITKVEEESKGVENTTETEPVASELFDEPTVHEILSLNLDDEIERTADIELFRSGDAVFGSGTLLSDGRTVAVGVSGSVLGGDMDLNLVPVDGSGLYRLNIILNGESVFGSYHAYTEMGKWSGTVKDGFLKV